MLLRNEFSLLEISSISHLTQLMLLPYQVKKKNGNSIFHSDAVSYYCLSDFNQSLLDLFGDRDRLNAFLRRCVKLGYRDKSAPFIEDIFGDCDEQLFSRINTNSLHILQQYLPDRSSLSYSLRPRRHNKILITKTCELNDRDFIIRNIYKDLYWFLYVLELSIARPTLLILYLSFIL